MARMPQLPRLIGSALSLAVMAGLSGCVSQEQYNALKMQSDRLSAQLAQAEAEGNTARAEADLYKRSLDAIKGSGDTQGAVIANLTTQNGQLQGQLDELNRKYNEAIGKVGQLGTALPIPLTNELTAFAAANPDLVDFDSTRGIVKFKSDLTFALGSADLKPEAKSAIAKFASIVNGNAASGYELLVAGHTDNIPVTNPATKAAGHKDNWYLSSHRAIAVGAELISQRTSPQRIGVIGYADQRPTASNDSDAGRSKNRRVEVLILPTTVRNTAPASVVNAPAPKPAPVMAKPALNKDSAAVEPMGK